jgi:cystathionine beta-lyase/cystathionine gamma-synthase
MPPRLRRLRWLPAETAALSGVGDGTVRLSIGIEDTEDLIEDLKAALDRVVD